ncbi:MAG: FecR domain-containing protein [Nitrospinae bacterium]|nr:FecR domain-containing protein [Nitrospinota bacterium]
MNRYKSLFQSVLILIVLFTNPFIAFSEESAVGKVIGIVGKVEFLRGSDWKGAVFQQLVYAKDEFRTEKRSRLKILFNDDSLMALGPNSRLKIQSYLYKPKEKLRQGVVEVAHGLSMYIVNKSQKNKQSSFKILSPTANMAARGTQGYVSSSPEKTFLANQAGIVEASNINPSIQGSRLVGEMMKTIIPKDAPPSTPTPLQEYELKEIRKAVIGVLQIDALPKKSSNNSSQSTPNRDDEGDGNNGDNQGDENTSSDKSGDKKASDKGDRTNRNNTSGDSNKGSHNGFDSNQGDSRNNNGSGRGNQNDGSSNNNSGIRTGDNNNQRNADFNSIDFLNNNQDGGNSISQNSDNSGDFQRVNNPYDPSTLDSCQK